MRVTANRNTIPGLTNVQSRDSKNLSDCRKKKDTCGEMMKLSTGPLWAEQCSASVSAAMLAVSCSSEKTSQADCWTQHHFIYYCNPDCIYLCRVPPCSLLPVPFMDVFCYFLSEATSGIIILQPTHQRVEGNRTRKILLSWDIKDCKLTGYTFCIWVLDENRFYSKSYHLLKINKSNKSYQYVIL